MLPLKLDGIQSEWAEDEILEAYSYGLTYDRIRNKRGQKRTKGDVPKLSPYLRQKGTLAEI